MRFLAALLAVGWSSIALAQSGSATLTCTPPTLNTDGSPITGTISYRFYRGTAIGTYPTSQTSTSCSTVFTGLSPGTHYFVATAIVGGQESAQSAVASKIIQALPLIPNPPSGLTVQQDLTAYILNQSDNRVVMVPAGTVPAGTACDPTQQALGKYVVNKAAVTWAGSVRSAVVFASCL